MVRTRFNGRMVPTLLGLSAAAVFLTLPAQDARAGHFDNSTIDDVDFGPTEATGGSRLDFNNAEFDIGIDGSGGNFDSTSGDVSGGSGSDGRWVYSSRSVQGSFSNSNEAGTKSVFFEWLMTEPDTTKRSLTGASLQQKHDVILRVTLYTTGGTTTRGETEVEDCSVKATARSPKDSENPTSVKMTLHCKQNALSDMGFSEDEIDCIQEALESRSRSIKYVYQD